MTRKVLIVVAHPDDEVLGCGGTIARMSARGAEVKIGILGEGLTSRTAKTGTYEQSLSMLRSQAKEAASCLGAELLEVVGLPDNRMDTLPLLDVVKIIERWVDDVRPDTVYTHHSGDLNIDHVITHRATLTAIRPMKNSSVSSCYAFGVCSSTEWAFNRADYFSPDTFIDISLHLQKKLEAMSTYAGEVRDFPHPRSLENIKAEAANRGAAVGFSAAEAFQTIFRRA